MNRQLVKSICLLLFLSIFLSSCGEDDYYAPQKSAVAVPVKIMTISLQDFEVKVKASGYLSSQYKVEINSSLTGKLDIHQHEGKPLAIGTKVEAGTILATVDEENVKLNLRAAQLAFTRTQEELTQTRKTVSNSIEPKERLRIAEFENEAAKIELEKAQQLILSSQLQSPIAGVITQLPNFVSGQTLSAGQLFATIENMEQLFLTLRVPLADVSKLQSGQHASIRIDEIADHLFDGTISEIGLTVNDLDQSVIIKILVPNKEKLLKPGMYGEAQITVQNLTSVVRAPKKILKRKENKNYVFLVREQPVFNQSVAQLHEVEIGISDDTDVVITAGLQEGDQVVSSATQDVVDNGAIQIIK